jgi:hypothetical protein
MTRRCMRTRCTLRLLTSLGQRETKQNIALPDVAAVNGFEVRLQREVDQLA